MSAPEVANAVERVMSDLTMARIMLAEVRQLVITSRSTLMKLESTNAKVTSTVTRLAQTNTDIDNQVHSLLSAHDSLTDFRIDLI